MPSMPPERLDHFRELLLRRERELRALLDTRARGAPGALSVTERPEMPDDNPVVDQLNDDTFAQVQVHDRELAGVRAALARIDDGSYGECIDCGEPIPEARLEVEPQAVRCIADQQQFEKRTADAAFAQSPHHRSM